MLRSPSLTENSTVTSQTGGGGGGVRGGGAKGKSEDHCVEAMELPYPALPETKILSRADKQNT